MCDSHVSADHVQHQCAYLLCYYVNYTSACCVEDCDGLYLLIVQNTLSHSDSLDYIFVELVVFEQTRLDSK